MVTVKNITSKEIDNAVVTINAPEGMTVKELLYINGEGSQIEENINKITIKKLQAGGN